MKQATAQSSLSSRSSRNDDQFAVMVVLGDLLDTTWRIAVPVVVCAVGGIFADRMFGTKPWLTLCLTAVGFAVAALLVKRQLKSVTKKDDK